MLWQNSIVKKKFVECEDSLPVKIIVHCNGSGHFTIDLIFHVIFKMQYALGNKFVVS